MPRIARVVAVEQAARHDLRILGYCLMPNHVHAIVVPGSRRTRNPGPRLLVVERAGSSMANFLKVQVSLVDPVNNWGPMTETYNTFFPDPKPVRNYFGATGFRRPGQLLQIDCIAYVD